MDRTVKTVVVHDGKFHADDVLAVALALVAFPGCTVRRTRDSATVAAADLALDVGSVFDPGIGRLDHHMADPPRRPDGVPYSSFGLLWRELGPRAVRALAPDASEAEAGIAWREMDADFVLPVDKADNGVGGGGLDLAWSVDALNAAMEGDGGQGARFDRAVQWAGYLLSRVCRKAVEAARADAAVRAAAVSAPEPRIVACVPGDGGPFENRKSLPAAWAGLRGEDLETESGVTDAVFCHRNLFVGGARSRQAALAMAEAACEA